MSKQDQYGIHARPRAIEQQAAQEAMNKEQTANPGNWVKALLPISAECSRCGGHRCERATIVISPTTRNPNQIAICGVCYEGVINAWEQAKTPTLPPIKEQSQFPLDSNGAPIEMYRKKSHKKQG